MRLLLLFALIVLICSAQQTAPVIVARTEPDFPDEARKAGVDGTVVVELVVDTEGHATNLRIKKPIGFGFDEAALQKVATWKFTPGAKDGVTVPVGTTVEVNFRSIDKNPPLHIQRFSCELPEGAARPMVLKAEHPAPPRDSYETVSAELSLEVNEQGMPMNFHFTKLSDSSREEDIARALREWQFQPSGSSAAIQCRLSFTMGPAIVSYKDAGISPPHVIRKVEPIYPDEARRARVEGMVVLFLIVDASGRPRDLKVLKPLGSGLDEAAIESVRQWVFEPGRKDGKAVAVQATIQVNFRLREK